jgi:hypothetical protein
MLNNSNDTGSDTRDTARDTTDLMPPNLRREILQEQIDEIGRTGYRLASRVGYVAVMAKPGTGRIEIFIDEFGHSHLTS